MALNLRSTLGLPAENIIVITKERAARADFSSIIDEWLPKNLSSDSRLYFYFAGHGAIDPSDQAAYLLPWDADLSFLRSSAYPLKQFFQKLELLKAREIVVLLDCCFGADGDRCRESHGLRPLVPYQDSFPNKKSKLTVLFAASKTELAGLAAGSKGGVFTEALISGLSGQEAERTAGTLTVDELFFYVQKKVMMSASRQGRTQSPRLYTSNRDLRIY